MSDPFGQPDSGETDDFEIDLPEEEEADFSIPAGLYKVECADIEKQTSSAGNPMWVFFFETVEGPHKGHELRVYCAHTPAAMWKLRETLEALGLGEGGKKAKFSKTEAIGKKAMATVIDDEYNGVKRSSIDTLAPL